MFGQVFKLQFADMALQGIQGTSCVRLVFRSGCRCFLFPQCKRFSLSNDACSGSELHVDPRLAVGDTLTLVIFRICGLYFAALAFDTHRLCENISFFFPGSGRYGCVRLSRLADSMASDVQRQSDASGALVVLVGKFGSPWPCNCEGLCGGTVCDDYDRKS